MIDLTISFPQCLNNTCTETTNNDVIFVVDTITGKSEIFKHLPLTPPLPFFKIINCIKKTIFVTAIDNCVFFPVDGKKCDFVVYDERLFCFVELKRGFNPSKKSQKKKEAIEQLSKTISDFKQKIDFENYKLEAYPCVGYKTTIPRCSATDTSTKKRFWDLYKVELCEGNSRKFS